MPIEYLEPGRRTGLGGDGLDPRRCRGALYAPSSSSPTRMAPSPLNPWDQKPPTSTLVSGMLMWVNRSHAPKIGFANTSRIWTRVSSCDRYESMYESCTYSVGDDLLIDIHVAGAISDTPDAASH